MRQHRVGALHTARTHEASEPEVDFACPLIRKDIISHSEPEPADSLRDKSNVIGGWLPSLTLCVRPHRAALKI
jgi:hypothetical protein